MKDYRTASAAEIARDLERARRAKKNAGDEAGANVFEQTSNDGINSTEQAMGKTDASYRKYTPDK